MSVKRMDLRTESDVDYDIDLNLLSFDALLDWFPFSGKGIGHNATHQQEWDPTPVNQ